LRIESRESYGKNVAVYIVDDIVWVDALDFANLVGYINPLEAINLYCEDVKSVGDIVEYGYFFGREDIFSEMLQKRRVIRRPDKVRLINGFKSEENSNKPLLGVTQNREDEDRVNSYFKEIETFQIRDKIREFDYTVYPEEYHQQIRDVIKEFDNINDYQLHFLDQTMEENSPLRTLFKIDVSEMSFPFDNIDREIEEIFKSRKD
jgi:hypothetical protein